MLIKHFEKYTIDERNDYWCKICLVIGSQILRCIMDSIIFSKIEIKAIVFEKLLILIEKSPRLYFLQTRISSSITISP